MAHSVGEQRNSPANRLRAAVEQAERSAGRLKAEEVESFLVGLDDIVEQFQELEAGGLDLRPERTRLDSLLSRLDSHPRLITAPASSLGGLAALRHRHPPASGAWWHLDDVEAERRKRLVRRLLTSLGVLMTVILVIYVVLTYVFPPDPNAVLASDATGRLPELVATGKWEAADALIAKTLAHLTTDDVELLVWQSVVAQHLGRQKEADAAFARAQSLVPQSKQATFWSTVGNVRLSAGDLDGAKAAGDKALVIDPNAAQAYFLLAGVAEARGEVSQAIDYFQKTFDLAADKNPQLAVIARVRMGMLMQSAPPVGPVTTTVPAGP